MQQLLLALAPPPPPTLENFHVGRNGAALQALRGALDDGERFVYLWGPGGCGKTHLLRGFAAAAGADFLSAGAAAWPSGEGRRAAAVDDVARLNAEAQIGLFDLCNRLRAAGGALAASGGTPPAQLSLRPDLRSRLASGIVLQLHPLNDEEKAAALRRHAAERSIALGEETLRYLLTHFDRDMGTQIAALDAIDRYSLERKRAITLPLVKEALRLIGLPSAG
jgi:DnaA family protein